MLRRRRENVSRTNEQDERVGVAAAWEISVYLNSYPGKILTDHQGTSPGHKHSIVSTDLIFFLPNSGRGGDEKGGKWVSATECMLN